MRTIVDLENRLNTTIDMSVQEIWMIVARFIGTTRYGGVDA